MNLINHDVYSNIKNQIVIENDSKICYGDEV
jgi:hypothetical protein